MLRKLIVFLVLITSLFSFTSCRSKTPDAPKELFDGIVLNYYKMYDDADFIQPFISEYEASHPGLKINYRQFLNFDDYLELIINKMAEGGGPDIFSMQNTWFYTNYKKLTPLPKEQATVEDYDKVFVDVASKDLVRTDQDGVKQVFGVPMTIDTLALYYNKDHFSDKLASKGRPSETWSELMDDVAKLTEVDNSFSRFKVSGIALGRADNVNRAVDVYYLLLLQYGVDFYNDLMSKVIFAENQQGVVDNAALSALDIILSFSDENNKNYSWNEFINTDIDNYREIDAFVRGDVSMIIGYAFTYDEIMDRINVLSSRGENTISKDAVKTSLMPQLSSEFTSKQKRTAYASYFAETVSRNSKYPDIAWDFLIFLVNKENQQKYFAFSHNPTSRRDLIKTQSNDPIYGVFAKQIGFAESFPVVDYFSYKSVFSKLIDDSADGGDRINLIRKAKDSIQTFLPSEGYYIPELINKDDEKI